jgi:hypothetical protein
MRGVKTAHIPNEALPNQLFAEILLDGIKNLTNCIWPLARIVI